jgi:hypothetical protein
MARDESLTLCMKLMASMLKDAKSRKGDGDQPVKMDADPVVDCEVLLDLIQAAQSVYSEFCPIL